VDNYRACVGGTKGPRVALQFAVRNSSTRKGARTPLPSSAFLRSVRPPVGARQVFGHCVPRAIADADWCVAPGSLSIPRR